ncbi:MAG: hypothetical protein ABJN40_13395 [Sneathiella sp.]
MTDDNNELKSDLGIVGKQIERTLEKLTHPRHPYALIVFAGDEAILQTNVDSVESAITGLEEFLVEHRSGQNQRRQKLN